MTPGEAQARSVSAEGVAAALPAGGLSARLRHIALFAALGAVGTLAHYTVLIGLVHGAGLGPVAASSAGFVTGGLVNYQLSRRIAFRSSKPHGEALGKFFIVAGIGLVLNALLMALLTGPFSLPYLPAQVGVTAFLVLWHYGGNAVWTFREARREHAPGAGPVLPPA
ncbi:GtrA family protein [Ancylobacter sp. 6x-1]|uniref:GtrA family protein n=1 Tax=Ancylobacter crimeensis TaxID=2579147 RepID=A0ABT0D7I7_9HYPH|nr:GtrA family protein [Ancylobacter crimeensis]MCK0195912.1 GtrA family protein [Ancylobacter crimeensis]